MSVQLFVVTRSHLVCAGISSIMEQSNSIQVVGAEYSVERARESIIALGDRVDVVLLETGITDDENMREGVVSLTRLSRCHRLEFLLMVNDRRENTINYALRLGARGIISSDVSPDQLGRAVETVADGGLLLGRGFSLNGVSGSTEPAADCGPLGGLTMRESEILDLVASGQCNGEIAKTLMVSEKTVRNHVSRLYAKLGVTRRVEAVLLARRFTPTGKIIEGAA